MSRSPRSVRRAPAAPAPNRSPGAGSARLRPGPRTIGARPGAVEVQIVADAIEVPDPLSRRPRADLGDLEPLGTEEPLHVGGRRADAQGPNHLAAELAQLAVALHRDAIRRRDLRRDGTIGQRLENARIVVRDELEARLAVDRHRVVEAFVPLDELLHRGRLASVHAQRPRRALELRHVPDAKGLLRTETGDRLQDQRKARGAPRTRAARPARRRPRIRRRESRASRSACFIAGLSRHRRAERNESPGRPSSSRAAAALSISRSSTVSRRSTGAALASRPHRQRDLPRIERIADLLPGVEMTLQTGAQPRLRGPEPIPDTRAPRSFAARAKS